MQDLPVLIYVHSLYFIVSYHWEDLFFHVSVRSEQQKKSHNSISNQKVLANVPCSASASKHWTHTATTQLSEVLSHKKNLKGNVKFQFISQRKAEENLFFMIFTSTSFSGLSYDCKSLFSPICLQGTKMCICSALCSFHRRSKTIRWNEFYS